MDSGGGADRISALPDDLLRCILTRVRCIRTAVRTGALSRRWRRVWTQLRELAFVDRADRPHFTPAVLDAITSAIDGDDLERLDIDVAYGGGGGDNDNNKPSPSPSSSSRRRYGPYPAARLAPLLRLASRRLAGELRLVVRPAQEAAARVPFDLIQQELPLPACARATAVRLHVEHYNLKPSFPDANCGAFAALRVLAVACYAFGKLDVGRLVQCCPRLQELTLAGLLGSAGVRDLAIRSASLQRLELHNVLDGKFTVEAPRLVRLLVSDCQYKDEDDDDIALCHDDNRRFKNVARIVAPMLEGVIRTHSALYCTCQQSPTGRTA